MAMDCILLQLEVHCHMVLHWMFIFVFMKCLSLEQESSELQL